MNLLLLLLLLFHTCYTYSHHIQTSTSTSTQTTMSKRVMTVGGGALFAGLGYYLYAAGGDPKVAEKKFEGELNKLCLPEPLLLRPS